jgi:hypothetical protein
MFGADDIMFAIILIIGLFVVKFWLQKIYNRVKDIDKIIGHYFKHHCIEECIK